MCAAVAHAPAPRLQCRMRRGEVLAEIAMREDDIVVLWALRAPGMSEDHCENPFF